MELSVQSPGRAPNNLFNSLKACPGFATVSSYICLYACKKYFLAPSLYFESNCFFKNKYFSVSPLFGYSRFFLLSIFVELQVLGLGLGVDFTFAWNNNNDNNKNDKNPHLNFWKGTALGDKEQEEVGIRD